MRNLARELLEKNVIPKWTVAEFEALDRKTLVRITASNGKATEGLPVEIQEKIKLKGMNEADKGLALKVLHSGKVKNVCATRPETHMSTHGGVNFFRPTEVTYQSVSGKTERRANSAIPIHFEEVEKRPNVQAVAALCAQLVRNDAGVWKPNLNPIAWSKVFVSSSCVRVAGMMSVAGTAAGILNADMAWHSMPQLTKNAVTGIELLSFVRSALDRVSVVSYDLLNTSIVLDGLKVLDKDVNGWFKWTQDNGEPWVPETAYKITECCNDTAEILADGGYPHCYWYYGNISCDIAFPPKEGTIKSALLSSARMREVQGSDQAPSALLAGMRGYSGLNDEFGKRCQFLVSATLSTWQRRRPAAIWLESVGDIPILVSSLLKHKKEIQTGKHDRFNSSKMSTGDGQSSALVQMNTYECEFKLVVPKQMDMLKVHTSYRDHVVVMAPVGSVTLLWSTAGLPTSDTKGVAIQYDDESQRILPDSITKGDYIAYCAIYGVIPFPNDARVKFSNSQKFESLKWWEKKPLVYKWSNTSGFKGILSTFDNLELYGWGYPQINKTDLNELALQFIPIKLEQVATQKEWYDNVSTDAQTQALSFLNVVSRYSPISNLCCLGAKGVTIARMSVTKDEGLIVPNMQEVANRAGQSPRVRVESKWVLRPPVSQAPPPIPVPTKTNFHGPVLTNSSGKPPPQEDREQAQLLLANKGKQDYEAEIGVDEFLAQEQEFMTPEEEKGEVKADVKTTVKLDSAW